MRSFNHDITTETQACRDMMYWCLCMSTYLKPKFQLNAPLDSIHKSVCVVPSSCNTICESYRMCKFNGNHSIYTVGRQMLLKVRVPQINV